MLVDFRFPLSSLHTSILSKIKDDEVWRGRESHSFTKLTVIFFLSQIHYDVNETDTAVIPEAGRLSSPLSLRRNV